MFTASTIRMNVEDTKSSFANFLLPWKASTDDKRPTLKLCRNVTSRSQGKELGTRVLTIFSPRGTWSSLEQIR